MKRIFKITFIITALTLFFASCVKDLNTTPIDPNDMTSANVYTNPAAYKQVLAKCYAGLSVSGQQGAAGNPDISGIDEGFGEYLRGYWYHQELTTDEAVIGWNDQTIKNFHYQNWGSSDVFIAAMYYRIFYQVSLCNEFIRESTDAQLDAHGITNPTDRANIASYRAEARFLRALSYFHALDLFGNVPFVTENDPVGKFFPSQISRANLYAWLETELIAIEPLMTPARQNEFGRADQAAVQTLLARLYLNAEVYAGLSKYTECITYCNKVMNAGYTLEPQYKDLFLADNNNSGEVIFPIEFDGMKTRTWGGTTFIIHAAIGGSMTPADYGVAGGWGGTRTTSAFVRKFYPDLVNGLYSSPRAPRTKGAYPTLRVPGSYQNWTPADAPEIASVAADGKYEGYIDLPADAKFKFTLGTTWDVNWGGVDGVLSHGGADIQVTEAGYFKINVDTVALTYELTKTVWGVVGSATGSWDIDQPMAYDANSGTWTATLDLSVGAIKFRANSAWAINYGGANGILVAGGADLAIADAGTYVITMKLGTPDYTYSIVRTSFDRRPMFYTDGQNLEIEDISVFNDGYAITKFSNMTSTGVAGQDGTFCDTDFPLFRLGEVYLMYAEAVLRGGSGGDLTSALEKVNAVRARAFGGSGGGITPGQLTLDFILDERGRELYWEGYRRTDLIRFGKFSTGTYVWPWKGGVAEGIATSDIYNLFPIPSADVSANPNLIQNRGY